jgi:hypothetical protein
VELAALMELDTLARPSKSAFAPDHLSLQNNKTILFTAPLPLYFLFATPITTPNNQPMDFGITIESGQIIIGKPAHNHEPATHKRSFEEMESTDDNLSTDESSDDGETTSDEDYTSSDEETVTPIAKRTKSKSKKQKINGNSGRQVTIDIKHIFANGTSIHRCV